MTVAAAITIVVVASALVPPSLSVDDTETVYVPTEPYACDGVCPEPVVPSPKFQLYVNPAKKSAVLGSVAEAMKVTAEPTLPAGGPETVVVGAASAIVTVAVLVVVLPAESVTFISAV